jgi:hypothetical protein
MPWNVINNPCQAKFGVWNDSGVAGYGILLNSTRQFGLSVACDDGGTVLPAGWFSAVFGQTLLTVSLAGAHTSAFGVCGEMHVGSSMVCTSGGNLAGVFAYAELGTTFTWTAADNISFSGLLAGIDVPSGAIIAANSVASCIAVGGNFGGTHTGKLVALHVTNPGAGAYDGLFQLGWQNASGDGTGLLATATGVTTIAKGLKVYSGTTLYYIPLCTGTT